MLFSVHPDGYDIQKARTRRGYGANFTKDWQTYETRSSAELSHVLTSRVWSPCVFKDGHRRKISFVEARLMVLDFDAPGFTLAQALEQWRDTIHWIGTTKSHQREKNGVTCDRFRVVIPFAEAITDHQLYTYNYELVIAPYESADTSTKDGARLFFPCQQIVSVCLDGYPQDVQPISKAELKRQERAQKRSTNFARTNILPSWIRTAFREVVLSGTRNDTWYRVACELCRQGWEMDRVIDAIIGSATYREQLVSAELSREICGCVRSAYKAVSQDPQNLGQLEAPQS